MQVRVAEAWEIVAGPSAASHTTGAHVRDGELVVYVDSPVWATELSALAALYRQEINKQPGSGSGKDRPLQCIQKGRREGRAEAGRRR